MLGQCSYLGKMSDSDDLVALAEFTHLETDGASYLTAHVRINFVKKQQWRVILFRESAFEGEQDAGKFSAGSYLAERFQRFAGVGTKEEFGSFSPMRSRF